ncbi:50S ribosomal protein L29 [Saprospira grandis]|uniref:Large ribosomal subunit protein uL29 n=1 Tax=Saprospira grandis (strain Lewin) TaxID=984262 RepID=H6L0N5_SAPGL|nr:50S ribosomal protein L29 [Saprospira grandis]AFC24571.1 ribosomal protein L29 [Saprospira grandis str. Lewin]WBM76010.1 50S ribosomal protein L29 [Saprospira grandis]
MDKIKATSMTDEQLREALEQAETALHEMVYQHNVSALARPSDLKLARKNIARIKTELRARELKQLEEAGDLKRDRIRARRKKK